MNAEKILGKKEEVIAIMESLGLAKEEKHPNPLVHKILSSMRQFLYDDDFGLYVLNNYSHDVFTEVNALIAIALNKAGYYYEAREQMDNIKAKCRQEPGICFGYSNSTEEEKEADTEATALSIIALKEIGENCAAAETAESMKKELFSAENGLFLHNKEKGQLFATPNAYAIMALNMLKDPLAKEVAKKAKEKFTRQDNLIWNGWSGKHFFVVSDHFITCLALKKAGEDISPYIEAANSYYSEKDCLFFNEGKKSQNLYDNTLAALALKLINDPRGKAIEEKILQAFLTKHNLLQEKTVSNEDRYSAKPNVIALLSLMDYSF